MSKEITLSELKEMSPFEFKNILNEAAGIAHKKHKASGGTHRLLSAGRGNPNFLNTTVRNAFSYLELFVSHLSEKNAEKLPHLGYRPSKEGIAKKLEAFLQAKGNLEEVVFLKDAIRFAIKKFSFDPDEFVFELCDASLGDYYPNPPRMLEKTEEIVKAYLFQIIDLPKEIQKRKFDLFATEGASAAMIYLFNSLKTNKILKDHDEIAILTPVFAPYLELPLLSNYNLKPVFLETSAKHDWQLPDSELEKLKNPKVKAVFIVNPTNPTSVALDESTVKKIGAIIKKDRKDLIVIVDTVYCTFVEKFYSFLNEVPENTIFIYSYSKYFGVTGWRLGVFMIEENNIVDRLIRKLPDSDKKILHDRYKLVVTDPENFKFIDRLESDSREESLAHTGGLSCPQQAIMCLFSLFHLMDEKLTYKAMIRGILIERAKILFKSLDLPFKESDKSSYYYYVLDVVEFIGKKYEKGFAEFFKKNVHILEFLIRLAKEKYTICLPGVGFHGPKDSLRISLANLDDAAYVEVGKNIKELIDVYHKEWKAK